MLYAGRWPSEDAAGVVESVRFVSARTAHIVDVNPLRRVGAQLFSVPSRAKRERSRWFDVAEVRVVADAEYLPKQDAYRVPGARDGYAELTPAVLASLADQKKIADEEYLALQRALLRETALASLAGTLLFSALFREVHVTAAYLSGAAAGFLYLVLLQRAVDSIGAPVSSPLKSFLGVRFIVPVLPFLVVSANSGNVLSLSEWQYFVASIPKLDALAIVLGLLTFKVPLLLRTFTEFVDGLSQLEVGKTGMIGTVAGMAARRIKNSSSPSSSSSTTIPANKKRKRVLIFAGPSGAGKSTLVRELQTNSPQWKFEYIVSHTTRQRRDGEQDGRDYYFVSAAEFDDMISRDEFVEYAEVHGASNKYGTSLAAINNASDGSICLLDLDVQGVETVRRKQLENNDWDARFVWVAPPSIYALEERLRSRATESDERIARRLKNATKELAYAATSDVFDLILINDNVERALAELGQFVKRTCQEWDRADEELAT